jgi:hypothetical protein
VVDHLHVHSVLIEVDRRNQRAAAFLSLVLLKTFSLAGGGDDDGSQGDQSQSEQELKA